MPKTAPSGEGKTDMGQNSHHPTTTSATVARDPCAEHWINHPLLHAVRYIYCIIHLSNTVRGNTDSKEKPINRSCTGSYIYRENYTYIRHCEGEHGLHSRAYQIPYPPTQMNKGNKKPNMASQSGYDDLSDNISDLTPSELS